MEPDRDIARAANEPAVRCWWRSAAWVALALALVYFLWRGPARALTACGDLTVGYAASQAWIAGEDPYRPEVLMEHLASSGAGEYATPAFVGFMRNLYLPVTIPTFVPLAVLPWPAARAVWVIANTVGLGVTVWGVLRLAGILTNSDRGLWLLVLALALAPVHTAIAIGQVSIISVMLLTLAFVQEKAGRPWWAGLLYGLAAAVKVQIGLPFVAWALWRRQWAAGAGAVIVLGVLTGVALARMEATQVDWVRSRQANVEQTMSSGGYNDATRSSPGRYTLINLQYLVHDFTDSRLVANGVTLAVVGGLGLLLIWQIRGRNPEHQLLALATVATLTLVVTYHRTYDAVLMLIPAGWALAGLGQEKAVRGGRGLRWGVLVCCASLIFPGQVLFQQLGERGAIPGSLAGSTFWQATVMSQHVWAILICAGLLVWHAWQKEC